MLQNLRLIKAFTKLDIVWNIGDEENFNDGKCTQSLYLRSFFGKTMQIEIYKPEDI